MPKAQLLTRHERDIRGTLSCFDRVIITGTLMGAGHAKAMTAYLRGAGIPIFEYANAMAPLRDALKESTERLAQEQGLTIDYITRPKSFRKEERISEILKERGEHPGLVHIFSVMETCSAYKPWHDKKTGETALRSGEGRCLHYYFYFIDEDLGLCFLRVPTYAPFRLMFYYNGHNRLASGLRKAGIKYEMLENAFLDIADFKRAQEIADGFDVQSLHKKLDALAQRWCPCVVERFSGYHWSLDQVEYSTDVVFKSRQALADVYEALTLTAIHVVKPENIATFLGRQRLSEKYEGEIGSSYSTRIEGTRIRHHMGPASIKMYDKFGQILRIETTTYDVSYFKHHRMVEQKEGAPAFKLACVRKTIYSMTPDLQLLMEASNQRYLDFISTLDDPTAGIAALRKVSEPKKDGERRYRGLNFFQGSDQDLIEAVAAGEHTISGFRAKDLRKKLPALSRAQLSVALKRLRTHGIAKKVGRTYKYYLTTFGQFVVLTGLKLKNLVLIPALAATA